MRPVAFNIDEAVFGEPVPGQHFIAQVEYKLSVFFFPVAFYSSCLCALAPVQFFHFKMFVVGEQDSTLNAFTGFTRQHTLVKARRDGVEGFCIYDGLFYNNHGVGVRGAATTIAVISLWLAYFILVFTFPILFRKLKDNTFYIYSAICFLGMLFVWVRVKETRGVALEDMGDVVRGH